MKTLAQDTIIANARFFGGNVDLVPKQVKITVHQAHQKHQCANSFWGDRWPKKFWEALRTLTSAARRTITLCLLECDLQALTVGVGTVMDAKEVLVLITGANKAFALYKVFSQHWTFNEPSSSASVLS